METRCQYQHSRFIASLLKEGEIVITGLGHMLILEPVRMAGGIRPFDWPDCSHPPLLYCQGTEENHESGL